MAIQLIKGDINAFELSVDQEIDIAKLMSIKTDCNKMRRDNRFTEAQRASYKEDSRALSKRIDLLVDAYFTGNTELIADANAQIRKTKDFTVKAIEEVDHAAASIEQISALLAVLDKIISIIA